MKVSQLLNPIPNEHACRHREADIANGLVLSDSVGKPKPLGKSRRRFTPYEDHIIREGAAQGLTWHAIASLLPGRKRATCFNRFKTLIGERRTRSDVVSVTSDTSESTGSESLSDYFFV